MKKKFGLFLVFALALLTWIGGINPQEVKAEVIDYEIGTKNFNNTSQNSAKIGDQILQPEIGWRRYDDKNGKIKYSKATDFSGNGGFYKGSARMIPTNEKVSFRFYGSKLRIISAIYDSRSTGCQIKIDNQPIETFSQNIPSIISGGILQRLSYEKLNLPMGAHTVTLTNTKEGNMEIDAIEVDETGYLLDPPTGIVESISLDKASLNMLEGATEKIIATIFPEDAVNKKVIWMSSDSTIATVDENGNVTAIKSGQVVITATAEATNIIATCNVAVSPISKDETITVESEQSKLRVGQEFTTDIVLHNGINICAEDIKIDYNKDLFEYVGYDVINGLRVVKELKESNTGALRFIIASLGKDNAINGDKTILKLKFKAKAVGTGKVDVIKARIADNGTIEKDILTENCGEKEFIVTTSDVNRSGEFTLLDLGIDAWYYGANAEDTDTSKYDTDVVLNGKIDDSDLLEIVEQMLKNVNYQPNN